jgi:hypothetical protein
VIAAASQVMARKSGPRAEANVLASSTLRNIVATPSGLEPNAHSARRIATGPPLPEALTTPTALENASRTRNDATTRARSSPHAHSASTKPKTRFSAAATASQIQPLVHANGLYATAVNCTGRETPSCTTSKRTVSPATAELSITRVRTSSAANGIVSPARMPARSAGEPGVTSATV